MCYLTTEVSVRSFVGGNQKKVFGKRLVYLNKLLDDLGFWIEAQKYVLCVVHPICSRAEQISKSVGYPFKTYYPDSDPEPFRIVANYFKQFLKIL